MEYGRESANAHFHSGAVFRDATLGVIWIENQVSLGAGETIMAKIKFKQWLWEHAAAEI